MATNYKQLYKLLKTQKNDLLKVVNPEAATTPTIPADFNQTGWELTISQVETMLEKMKEANAEKGKRMTPQFFRAVFNRANSTIEELEKAKETRQLESSDFDFQAACGELSAEIAELMTQQKELGESNE